MGELFMEVSYSPQDISQLLYVSCCKLLPFCIYFLNGIGVELKELRNIIAIPSHVLLNQTDFSNESHQLFTFYALDVNLVYFV